MLVKTRQFGEIEIEEEKLLVFPSGLVGMKHLKRFIILDAEIEEPFRWLQSLDDEEIIFLTIEPRVFRPDYRVTVQKEELAQLGINKSTEVLVLCIVTLCKEPKMLTANLQGPLVINAENRIGKQVILVEGQYNTRHQILEEMSKVNDAGEGEEKREILEVKNR